VDYNCALEKLLYNSKGKESRGTIMCPKLVLLLREKRSFNLFFRVLLVDLLFPSMKSGGGKGTAGW